MLFHRNLVSGLVRSAFVALMISAAPGFGSNCCLSTIYNIETFKAILTSSGYTNVQTISNTCDRIAWSGTLMSVITLTYDYRLINTNDMEVTITTTTAGVPNSVKDTTEDICIIAAEKGLPREMVGLFSFPNPFQGTVGLTFPNPAGRADIRIFGADGAMVAEYRGVTESRFDWTPRNLPQGIYYVKISLKDRTLGQRVYFLK